MEELLQIPGYRVLEKVGEGEFRDVYRAWKVLEFGDGSKEGDRTDIYPCALKVYKNPGHIDTGLEELRVRRDSLKGGQGSEGIEQIYNFGQIDRKLFVETELIDGYPILEKQFEDIGRKRKCVGSVFTRSFSFPETVGIGIKIAKALEYLHSRGYVARDLSLTNIMVNDDLSVVKICDLDHIKRIGDVVEPENRPDGVTKIVGQDYMNFDMLENNDFVLDESTDVFALGACMLYMLRDEKNKIEAENAAEFREQQRSLVEGIDFRDAPEHLKAGMRKVLARTLGLDGESTRLREIGSFLNEMEPINRDFGLIYRYSGMPVIAQQNFRWFIYGTIRTIKEADHGYVYSFDNIIVLRDNTVLNDYIREGHPMSIDVTMDDLKNHRARFLTAPKNGNNLGFADYFFTGYLLKKDIPLDHGFEIEFMKRCNIFDDSESDESFFMLSAWDLNKGPVSFRFDDNARMIELPRDFDSPVYNELEKLDRGVVPDIETWRRNINKSELEWIRINELLEGSSEGSG